MELMFANMKNLKTKLVILLSIVLPVLALLAASTAPAVACEGTGESDMTCSEWRRQPRPAPTLLPTPVATPTPRGDSPTTARDITEGWQGIEPGASIWFKTNYSDGYRVIDLSVDSLAKDALGLSIFSPDQMDTWWNSKPVGRGTYNKGQPEHALTWVATYAKAGVWYLLLQNYATSPVSYRLNGNISATDTKKCVGYWETLPNGEYVYWVDCGHYTVIPP